MIVAALMLAGAGAGQLLGTDGASCAGGQGPAIQVAVTGLRDRRGNVKLELYPADEDSWLKDDRDLVRAGKPFRRIRVPAPATGPVQLCIRAPHAGRWALLFTHDRDGRNKFNIWSDGVGTPGNAKVGRARPKLASATIAVGAGGAAVTIRAQYLRGLSGFGPVD